MLTYRQAQVVTFCSGIRTVPSKAVSQWLHPCSQWLIYIGPNDSNQSIMIFRTIPTSIYIIRIMRGCVDISLITITARGGKVSILTHTYYIYPHKPPGRFKWPSVIPWLTIHFVCGVVPALAICKFTFNRKVCVFFQIWDTTEFGPGWDSNSQPSDLWELYMTPNVLTETICH